MFLANRSNDFADQVIESVSRYCRLIYSHIFTCIPHHGVDFSKRLTIGLKKWALSRAQQNPLAPSSLPMIFSSGSLIANSEASGTLEIEALSCVSGTVIQPLEFVGWNAENIVSHSMNQLLIMLEDIYQKNSDNLGEVLFAVSHHDPKGTEIFRYFIYKSILM
jgi:hypothetical protein